MPPVYDAKLVAKAIARAAERPTRRLVVGGGGRALATLEGLIPGAVDGFLTLTGFRGQRTRIPKSAGAPDNLRQPIDSGHSVAGGPETRGRNWSLYTAWTLSRWTRPATFALALGAGVLAARALTGGRRRNGRRHGGEWSLEQDRSRFEYRNPYADEVAPEDRSGRVARVSGRQTPLRE